jgi:hypothetical protein
VELQGFRAADIAPLMNHRPDMMIVYDTAWDPLHIFRSRAPQWLLRHYYGYEPAMSPDAIAAALSMRVLERWERRGLSMTLLVRGNAQPEYRSELSQDMRRQPRLHGGKETRLSPRVHLRPSGSLVVDFFFRH